LQLLTMSLLPTMLCKECKRILTILRYPFISSSSTIIFPIITIRRKKRMQPWQGLNANVLMFARTQFDDAAFIFFD
jgi:hypothetical protein